MKKSIIIALIIILVSFAIALYFYARMPVQMASHWNIQGEVDSYMPKFWGLFLMPIISLALLLLFLLLPKIDPLKENIEKFKNYYYGFILILILFLFYIYLLSILWNLDFRFTMIKMMAPALTILFYYIGIFLEKSKRNWFIGIRTPWTLSSDIVWNKTHHLGAKLFKISGIIILLSIFFPLYAIYFILIPILGSALYLIVYSYFEYRKIK